MKKFAFAALLAALCLSAAAAFAENPAVPPRIYQGEALDHIRVLGLAVGLTRKL